MNSVLSSGKNVAKWRRYPTTTASPQNTNCCHESDQKDTNKDVYNFSESLSSWEKWKWKRKHNKTKLRWANSKEEFTSDFTASFPGAYLLTFSREEEKELLGTKVQIVKSYDDVIGNSLLTSKFTSASIAYFQRKGSMPDTNWLQTFNELVKLRNCWHS